MDWYTVIKIGILIFGLISWLLYKGDRGVNREILEEHLSQREPIRDLTDEELELLHPYLTSKITVYPYKFQSSLIDNHVSYLRGACSRNSLYSNTNEIAYYYQVNNIELFFPYGMDRYIDEFNIIEVVFTKQYGIVVKINGHDIKTASENYDPNEEYEFGDLKNTNLLDDRDSVDIESLTLNGDNSEESINQTFYQREETQFEATSKHNLGVSTSLCLILATVFLIKSWFSENEQIYILTLIFLSAAAFFVWYKPKRHSTRQQVKVIKAKIYEKHTSTVVVGKNMVLKYPKYWLNFIPKTSNSVTEMDIGDNGRKLLRYGHTLFVNNEVEQFGPPKFIIRNTILFIVGLVLSAVLYYFTDPINNGYFAYRYFNQQSHNLQINDLTTLENSDIEQGDIVNISIKNVSCDVNDLKDDYKCHHFFINSQPMTLIEDSVMSIESSLKHIFDPKFVNVIVDSEMIRLQNAQQQYVDMLNKYAIKRGEYYVKKSFSKIEKVGQIVIDIEKVCKITPVEQCDNIKSHIVRLFDSGKDGITWDDLLASSAKNPKMNEIVESNRVNYLKNELEPFKLELQKKLKKIVSQYQSENVIEITLTNQSYIDMAQLVKNNSMKFDEYGYVNYYLDILTNIALPDINIVGVVSDIRYREDQNSNTKSISALKVNANHHYNLKANQPLSPLFLINMLIFVVMTLTATINGIQLVRKIIINRHRTSEIKKYYEKRLGTIINL